MLHAQTTSRSGSQAKNSGSVAVPTETTASIIHDLGNLIQIASSAVNIVARNPSILTANLEAVIAGAKTSLERAGALVRQNMSMARERASAREQVRVAACLAEVATLVQITWEGRIRLDVRTDWDLPFVQCDPLALQNAVLNLLLNARDAMPNGGIISVRAEAILLGSREGVELRVADSGLGMKPDTIARAFDPFFTTKSDGLGGVGLPTVERFVQDVGGRVLIESDFGVGTTVRLQLPASPQSRIPDVGSRAAPRGTQTHRPSGDDISDQIRGSLVFDEAEVSAVLDPRG
jgi:signal transduction histidine kinase